MQVTIFRDLTTRQCCSSQSLSQSIQETLWLCSVQSSLSPVQDNTVCSGSEPGQENPIQDSFTPKETGVKSVRRDLRLPLLHGAVSTASPRTTSAPLILGLTTVQWPHVERYCLAMEQDWMLVCNEHESRWMDVWCNSTFDYISAASLFCCSLQNQQWIS